MGDPVDEAAGALPVLRAIWDATGQSGVDLDDARPRGKVCRNMKNIGFGGIGTGGAAALDSTAVPVGDEMRRAWREVLRGEGKLNESAHGVADIVAKTAAGGADGEAGRGHDGR
ncbi:hypothetical protein [Pseudonocardia thermophila]|jgi:hypothetical protein|uniref:hypothetical protein n=1 Tax=Pseudonocardia thermophila TaxID=1848 RepID=UPI00248DF3D3|nr:hypothetical protein [Pseudonocardia thermophila]